MHAPALALGFLRLTRLTLVAADRGVGGEGGGGGGRGGKRREVTVRERREREREEEQIRRARCRLSSLIPYAKRDLHTFLIKAN